MLGATGSDESSRTRVARHNQPGAMVLYALAGRVVKGQGTAVEKPAAARGRGRGRAMQGSWQHNGAAADGASAIWGRVNIPTDLLRTFFAICDLGSFTKTANLLDLTQPAVSAHMRRLESMIGADLIAKSLTGVVLTECGTEVLRHARRMLAINDQIVTGSGAGAQPQVVRLCLSDISTPA